MAFTKAKYPALMDIDDNRLYELLHNKRLLPNAKSVLLESKHSLEPLAPHSCMEAIDRWQLPKGWGDFLLSLTNTLIEGIPFGMSSMAVVASTSNPHLTLLLKLVLIYAIAAKSGKKDPESEIITRSESKRIQADDRILGDLAADAQGLLDLFHQMPKLRNGGTRLFERMVDYINTLIK